MRARRLALEQDPQMVATPSYALGAPASARRPRRSPAPPRRAASACARPPPRHGSAVPASAGRCHGVRTFGPWPVIATVNSKCAAGEPSWEKIAQPSPPTRTAESPGGHHRLDRDHHALLEQRALAGLAVVGHLRILVHAAPDPVPDERAHDRQPRRLGHSLDRARDVAHAIARAALRDAGVQRLLGGAQQVLGLRRPPRPTGNVRAASATQPSSVTPTSIEMMSPLFRR